MRVFTNTVLLTITVISLHTFLLSAGLAKRDIGSAIIDGITGTVGAFGGGIKDTVVGTIDASKSDEGGEYGKSKAGNIAGAVIGGLVGGAVNTGKAIGGGIRNTVSEAKHREKRSVDAEVVAIESVNQTYLNLQTTTTGVHTNPTTETYATTTTYATTITQAAKLCECGTTEKTLTESLAKKLIELLSSTAATTTKAADIQFDGTFAAPEDGSCGCECICRRVKIAHQPPTTTTTTTTTTMAPTTTAMEDSGRKLCRCLCDRDDLFEKLSIAIPTTTRAGTAVDTEDRLCRCTCEGENAFHLPLAIVPVTVATTEMTPVDEHTDEGDSCECMCDRDDLFYEPTTTTTTQAPARKPCRCMCGMHHEITTTTEPTTTTVQTTTPKEYCRCVCENDDLFYEPITTTTRAPKRKPCRCMCSMEQFYDEPEPTTTPTTTTVQTTTQRLCQCVCDRDDMYFEPTTTTTQVPRRRQCRCACRRQHDTTTPTTTPTTTTVQTTTRKKLCRCVCDDYYYEPATTTTEAPRKRKCHCTCDEDDDSYGQPHVAQIVHDEPVYETMTTTPAIPTTTEFMECVKNRKCYSDADCYEGSCVGAFVGTCNCNACTPSKRCRSDIDCGGLIGACDLRRRRCDCQKAHSAFGFPQLIDTLTKFCHKRKCSGEPDSCNGLPCYSGVCMC
uniref:FAS1 domain-containing protein n=1 Tax=Strongyloides venezuelensis TaxID=75913 RepID=A0A0K0G2J4_STRVS